MFATIGHPDGLWPRRAQPMDNRLKFVSNVVVSEENNTNATMAAGDMNAEIKLRLADTVERFVITVSKAGIFESLAA